jgi:hypothetical protein
MSGENIFFLITKLGVDYLKKIFTFAKYLKKMNKRFILFAFSVLQMLFCVSQTRNDVFEILDLIHPDSIKRTVQDLQDFKTRRADRSPHGNLEVAYYLVARLQEYGIENARVENFAYDDYYGYDYLGYNVLGTIFGEIPDSTVIIGAHLDSKNSYNSNLLAFAPGADDNASGCAQTIEMARIFFEKGIKPRYNIDFMAYDFEEFGLLGARADAKKRKDANENIVVMLNNDMVGFQPKDEEWKIDLYWYDNSLDINDKAVEFCKEYTTITPYKPTSDENYTMYSRSDSYAYFEQKFKTTFSIEHTFSPYYHEDKDLLEYLNFDYQKQVAHLNMALLLYYSQASFELTVNDKDYSKCVEIAPNPATDFVRVLCYNDINISEIQIYDMVGRLVNSFKNDGTQHLTIDVQNYCKGVYFLKMITNEEVITKKMIKQ